MRCHRCKFRHDPCGLPYVRSILLDSELRMLYASFFPLPEYTGRPIISLADERDVPYARKKLAQLESGRDRVTFVVRGNVTGSIYYLRLERAVLAHPVAGRDIIYIGEYQRCCDAVFRLSVRQLDILDSMNTTCAVKATAAQLGVSEHTVRTHLNRAITIFPYDTLPELLAWSQRNRTAISDHAEIASFKSRHGIKPAASLGDTP